MGSVSENSIAAGAAKILMLDYMSSDILSSTRCSQEEIAEVMFAEVLYHSTDTQKTGQISSGFLTLRGVLKSRTSSVSTAKDFAAGSGIRSFRKELFSFCKLYPDCTMLATKSLTRFSFRWPASLFTIGQTRSRMFVD